MFDKNTFANIIKKIKDTYDSQEEFSKKSEIGRTYLSQYMNAKLDNPPSPKVLMKLANNSHNIVSYKELMDICGFITSNNNLDKTRQAQEILKYENLIKTLYLNNIEKDFLNNLFTEYHKLRNNNYSIKKIEEILVQKIEKLSNKQYNKDNMKQALAMYILSVSAQKVAEANYDMKAEIDAKINYFDYLERLKILDDDISYLKDASKFYMCPVYGQISAGQPNWAEECIEGRISIDTDLMNITNPEECFFLRVNGESMNKEIKNGAYALIRKTDFVENGEIAVVLVNGLDATLKKFSKQGDLIILEPMSDDPSIIAQAYDKNDDIKVIGKYIGKMEMK